MPGLEDLYREIILDHYRTPRNRGELAPPAVMAEGHNPLCGDEITIYAQVENGVLVDVKKLRGELDVVGVLSRCGDARKPQREVLPQHLFGGALLEAADFVLGIVGAGVLHGLLERHACLGGAGSCPG